MAASTAAYGARAGLETFVLLKEGTSMTSLRTAGIFGPRLIDVEGDYGGLFNASLEVGKRLGISFMNSIDPYRMEGYKLTAFEIFLQLGRRAPRFVSRPAELGRPSPRPHAGLRRPRAGRPDRGLSHLRRSPGPGLRPSRPRLSTPASTSTSGRPKSGRSPTPSPIPRLRPETPFCA